MTPKYKSVLNTCLRLAILVLLALLPAAPAGAGNWEQANRAGDAAYNAGNYAEAEKQFKQALSEAETFPANDKRLATTVFNLGVLYQVEEKNDQAEPLLKRAAELVEKAFGASSERMGHVLDCLGDLYRTSNQKQAEEYYLKALAIYEKVLGNESLDLCRPLDNVADFYAEQEDYARSEPLYRRAIDISSKDGKPTVQLAKELSHLAEMLCVQGKYGPAEPLFTRALAAAEKSAGPEDALTGKILFNFGGLHYDQGRFAEAESLFRRSIKIMRGLSADAQGDLSMCLTALGDCLDQQGKHGDADTVYKEALDILEKRGETGNLVAGLQAYQKHLNMSNRREEALVLGRRIRELKSRAASGK
jgi:tetratricopeptide (TPR) repeat protein